MKNKSDPFFLHGQTEKRMKNKSDPFFLHGVPGIDEEKEIIKYGVPGIDELLDSIYLPSKYPLGSALPEFEPNADLCRRCLAIAEHVERKVRAQLL